MMYCQAIGQKAKRLYRALKAPCALALSVALTGGLTALPDMAMMSSAYANNLKIEAVAPLSPIASPELDIEPIEMQSALMLLEDGRPAIDPGKGTPKLPSKKKASRKLVKRISRVTHQLKQATADKSSVRKAAAGKLSPIEDLAQAPEIKRRPSALLAQDDVSVALKKIIHDTPSLLEKTASLPEAPQVAAVKPTARAKYKPALKTAKSHGMKNQGKTKASSVKIIANRPMGTHPMQAANIEESYNLLSSNILNNLQEAGDPIAPPMKLPSSGKSAKLPPLMRPAQSASELDSGVKVLRSGVSSTINEIDVTINKAVILNLSQPAARVSISNPEIASIVVISPTQLQLIGNQVGVANLLVWPSTASSEHTIVDVQVHRDVSVLARQLKFVDSGIQIVPMAAEDTVILTGEAENRESAQLAVDLAKAFFKNGNGGSATPGGGGGKSVSGPSSASPGSALPGAVPNIINLINIKGEPSTKLELARQKLNAIDKGIELDIVPGADGTEKAILSGRVRTSSMISKAINTASVFYGQPGIKLITGPGGNSVRNAAGNNNFPGSDSFNDNLDVNILQGSVMTDTSGNVISMLEVSMKPQIKCSIQFIEVSKNNLDALGSAIFGADGKYSWSSLSGAQSTPSGRSIATLDQDDSGSAWATTYNPLTRARTSSMASGFSQNLSTGVTQAFQVNQKFTAAISALEEKRKARTLAEPTLTMLSGEKASFLAGGEVPIPVLGGNGQVNVTYHEFGIRMNLVATYLDNGKVHMLVAPEISSVDPTNGVSTASVTVPGFRTRRMQSTLELEQGQSFVLAGLYNQDEVWSLSRLPGAGSIPILGSLMRNKWKTNTRTELLVIIKPEVVMINSDPVDGDAYPMPAAAYNRPSASSANIPAGTRIDMQEVLPEPSSNSLSPKVDTALEPRRAAN